MRQVSAQNAFEIGDVFARATEKSGFVALEAGEFTERFAVVAAEKPGLALRVNIALQSYLHACGTIITTEAVTVT